MKYFATIPICIRPLPSRHAVTFFALLIMLHATAAAQLLHGTYFLAAISKDY